MDPHAPMPQRLQGTQTKKPPVSANRWRMLAALGPILLLAVIGVLGLQALKRSAFENARTETSRKLAAILNDLDAGLAALRQSSVAPTLYPAPPAPAEPNEAQKLFDEAADAPADQAAVLYARIETDFPNALAASGVPLLPLVKWAELSRQPPGAELHKAAEACLHAAVESHPSMVTPVLLERISSLVADDPAGSKLLEKWCDRWHTDESARTALRKAEAQSNSLPRWVEAPNGPWWVERETPDQAPQLFSKPSLREMTGSVISAHAADSPSYVALDLSFAGEPLCDANLSGDSLAQSARVGFQITAALVRPDLLYAAQRQQMIWLAVVVACSVGTAVAGIWSMQRAIDRERQLHELKSNFVASVSHELRAPVASMRVMAENLSSGIVTSAERRSEYHRLISEECWRLSTLIENVLDLSRIEQDRKSYRADETDVPALVADAVALMQPTIEQRKQTILEELRSLDQTPVCDGLAIQRALINLIDNASKFSPPSTAITIKLAQIDATNWSLSVTDQGPGISPEERDKIFERFYRSGSELRRETQGAGIGLSIVRHIAESHGGHICVSCPEAGGSQFTLSVPFLPPLLTHAPESNGSNPRS